MAAPELQTEEFERWINLLKYVNLKPRNIKLVHNFFDGHFGCDPKKMAGFLEYFKKYIVRLRNLEKRHEIAYKYFVLLSHLCEKYNFARSGQKIDNYCFKILNYDDFKFLSVALRKYKKNSKKYVDRVIKTLDEAIGPYISNYTLAGRYKNIYSIYKKITRYPERNIFQIRDIFAFRIILKSDSIRDCYDVVKILRRNFDEVEKYYKDYILHPKTSGYQSIHIILTNVVPNLDLPVEIQVRTKSMDNYAKHGLCAHWLYSKERNTGFITQKEKSIMRKELAIVNSEDTKVQNGIYCINQDGDVVVLKANHTILDYVYRRGLDVGNRVSKAVVNGKVRPFDYTIKDGDKIRLHKGKKILVRKNWLNFVYKKSSKRRIINCVSDGRNFNFGTSK